MSFYPEKINCRFYAPRCAGKVESANAIGTGASFVCGTFVRLFLEIDAQTKEIKQARFKSNSCGFALAAADVLAETIIGRKLTDFHGLDINEWQNEIELQLGKFGEYRRHCLDISIDALHQALADFRAFQLEEFAGERALICTCFGVSEETIEKVIAENQVEFVEEVGDICHAGTGCGSCRFLIQELIDVYHNENI